MGLDAFVYCRCWQDGLTPPAPVGPVGFDEEGYLSLLVAGDGYTEAEAVFDGWMASACPHELMEQASEHLANWTGYRLFQQALGAAGWSHFPTLRAELPSANGGRMPAEAAARVLGELDHFERQAVIDDEVVLVDEATEAVALRYVAAYQGVLMLGPGYRAGVDQEGFFVLDPDSDPPATLFRSARFRQRVLPGGQVQFSDEEKSVRIAMSPVGGAGTPPEQLCVKTRPQLPAEFDYIVEPLRRLCQAAVATGNPVMWC
ncbi:hypothetical protein [Actinoplanes flavus]|uniref:Uncharacterized protein n=1 Tax=Actinoplanes flavus TaxID=2820290 RepID=A0ABS3UZ79_9ACTN|nr:hypothetical protein [Actinoplanes flavus]MBO3743884.1 hypothetical protein [Actinoplanes flavus]